MKNKLQYLSFLNVVSCVAVVMLHTNGVFWTFSNEKYWMTANVIESVMYFAVPIFFMISGATLIDYRDRYSTTQFFEKRIKKTVVPFIFWNLFGLIYMINKYPNDSSNFDVIKIIYKFLNAQIITIYWFFIPLFSIYISIPILSLIKKEQRKKWYLYLAVMSFITIYLLPFLCSLIKIPYNSSLEIGVGSGYILYVIVGYLINNYEISKKVRMGIYLLSLIGLSLHLFGTYYLSINSNKIIDIFKGYHNVPCFIYSLGIFVFFKYLRVPKRLEIIFEKVCNLSRYTFGTYLLHFFVIDTLLQIFKLNIYSIYFRVITPFVVFIICIVIIKIVKKVPLLRGVLP